jgi:imidazolonepropionase
VRATFLGAHAIPSLYKENRKGYIDLVVHEMIPAVTLEGLADYCDVFCEKGFFTVEESERILKEAAKHGLKAKIHANELAFSGGVQLGVKMGAISVDHLECTGDEEIEALKSGKTLPTLLPGTSFFLQIPYAPARKLMEANLPVVLASDYNPGSSPSGNMPFILSLACIYMSMLPEEAINAVTINAAASLELENELGTISPGKWANLIQLERMDSLAFLPYAFGSNLIKNVFIQGHKWRAGEY